MSAEQGQLRLVFYPPGSEAVLQWLQSLYPQALYNVPVYALGEDILLVNLPASRQAEAAWINALAPVTKGQHVITDGELADAFPDADKTSVVLLSNELAGGADLEWLERQQLPPGLAFQVRSSPALPNKLSLAGKMVYTLRPNIVAAILDYSSRSLDDGLQQVITPRGIIEVSRREYYFNLLERLHVFIQIMCPSSEPSKLVPFMRQFTVTEQDIPFFADDPQFLKDTLLATIALMQHWGLQLRSGAVVVQDEARFRKTIGAYSNHNQARFTRFLNMIGYIQPQAFIEKLDPFMASLLVDEQINRRTRQVWEQVYSAVIGQPSARETEVAEHKEVSPEVAPTEEEVPTEEEEAKMAQELIRAEHKELAARSLQAASQPKKISPKLQKGVSSAHVAELLSEMATMEQARGDVWRSNAYRKAASSIKKYGQNITSTEQVKGLSGVGPKITLKVAEIIETQSLSKLIAYKQDPTIKAIAELSRVPGIGEETAKGLVALKIYTVDDLRARPDIVSSLPKQVRLSLPYLEELEQRISRPEVEQLAYVVRAYAHEVDPGIEVSVVGSYRRNAKSSGDIDILLSHTAWKTSTQPKPKSFQTLIAHLVEAGFITDEIGSGPRKYTALVRLSDLLAWKAAAYSTEAYPGIPAISGLHRHMDLRFFTQEELPFGLLYFTGSDSLNIEMRTHADSKGYKLNEYSLVDSKGRSVPARTEADIFAALGLAYVEPQRR